MNSTHIFTLAVGFAVLGTVPAAAQSDLSVRPQDSLSISLNSLRQSAARMRDRNEWLKSEIQVLEMKMKGADVAAPTSQRPRAVGPIVPADLPDSRVMPQSQDPAELSASQEQRLLTEIEAVEKDIHDMKAALLKHGTADSALPKDPAQQSRVKIIKENIKRLEQQLTDLERRNSDALGEYNRVKTANYDLKEKRTALTEKLAGSEAEVGRLAKDLESREQRLAEQISQERSAVEELGARKKRLDSVLKKADMRIDGKQQRLEISDQEIEVLMENRHFISAENASLKQQYSRLQHDWKEMEKSTKK